MKLSWPQWKWGYREGALWVSHHADVNYLKYSVLSVCACVCVLAWVCVCATMPCLFLPNLYLQVQAWNVWKLSYFSFSHTHRHTHKHTLFTVSLSENHLLSLSLFIHVSVTLSLHTHSHTYRHTLLQSNQHKAKQSMTMSNKTENCALLTKMYCISSYISPMLWPGGHCIDLQYLRLKTGLLLHKQHKRHEWLPRPSSKKGGLFHENWFVIRWGKWEGNGWFWGA